MEDLSLGQDTDKFMNTLFDDEVFSVPLNDGPEYTKIMEVLAGLGINIEDIALNIGGTQTIGEASRIVEIALPVLERFVPAISEVLDINSFFRECCSDARKVDSIGLQPILFDFGETPVINTKKGSISHIQISVVEKIMIFFLALDFKMKAIRRKRQMNRQNQNIKGKTNISANLIAMLGQTALNKLIESIGKGFTLLGINISDELDLLGIKKVSKEEGPYKLELKNKLEELKSLKDTALGMLLGENPDISHEQGYPLKMKPMTEQGFSSAASLLVYIGILFTILEFVLIFFSINK